MSVQLIVYPQSYNPLAFPVFYNYYADGVDFNGINTSSTTNVVTPIALNAAIHYQPVATLSPNTFGRFIETSSGASVTETSNALVFTGGNCGIVQKIQNLTAGEIYDVKISFAAAVTASVIHIEAFKYINTSQPPVSAGTTSATAVANTTITLQFTASNSSMLLAIYQIGALATINTIEVTQQVAQPSNATNLLANGQVICDLYEDEDIPLTLSVDNFKNVAEKTQSYSKDFNLPATKRNNKIFDNIF